MTAVAERPVTNILAAVAGFFVGTRRGVGCVGMALSGFLSEDRAGEAAGVGDGRSGSFSISRRPHHRRRRDRRYDDRRHDLRPHHGRHRHHDEDEQEMVSPQVE